MTKACGASHTGCVRLKNEDRILINEQLGLFVVVDGMGGHSHGERAAELALATIDHYMDSSRDGAVTWPFGYNFGISFDANRLSTAIQLANGQVWKHSQEAPEYAGMGTTVAAVVIRDANLSVANVGDTRIYCLREGDLRQVSTDDTWLNAVGGSSKMTRLQIQSHPLRNFLTQAAGSRQDLDVHTCEIELNDTDLVLICSDGLHSVVDDSTIASILRETGEDVQLGCDELIRCAKAAGGTDDVSCIVISA